MRALFDLSFQRFVTPLIVKIVYLLVMILAVLGYIGLVVEGFELSAGAGILMLVIVGPLVTILYLAFSRMFLEALIAQIRTAENTGRLAALAGPPPQGPPPGGQFPPPPNYPPPGYPSR